MTVEFIKVSFWKKISSPAVYSASKAAVIGLSRYLATYLAKFGIRVNTISPGGVYNNHNVTFTKNTLTKFQ